MKTIDDAGDIRGKRVLVRVDFDVPVVGGHIGEPFRIVRQKECIHTLLERGARVVLIAHITAVPSFKPLVPQLEGLLGVSIMFNDGDAQVMLRENLRADAGEEANDESFARTLVVGCDLFVNNAFAVCHREHASVARVPALLPSYAGPLIVAETEALSKFIDAPVQGKIVYMGGAKASTKAPVVRHLLDKAQRIAIGGVLANDIYKEMGRDIGNSRTDENVHELLAGLDVRDSRLHMPVDEIMEQGQIFDIGPQAALAFAELAHGASMIVWNGPMGKFEDTRFMAGTEAVARAIAASGATSVIGGGDTIAAVSSLGLIDQFTFVSTGGGSMLAFLAGTELPGLRALGYMQ
jgi:phosphoglycerate kinase